MNVAVEQLANANKANVETLLTIANTAFASAERLAALNLNTARSMLEDVVANAKALFAVKDVQEFMGLQASLAQPAVEKAVAYSRSVYEIATQTQEELSKVFEGQFSEMNKAVSSALDKAAEKGVIHKNNAARRKARLMKKLASFQPAEAKAEAPKKSK